MFRCVCRTKRSLLRRPAFSSSYRLESASVSNPVEDKIVMNSVRNNNFAKPAWPKTENFVDMRSGSDQTDAQTRFSRSFLRSAKILLQKRATLRNAAQISLPLVSSENTP